MTTTMSRRKWRKTSRRRQKRRDLPRESGIGGV
jgi:hypothetical protein